MIRRYYVLTGPTASGKTAWLASRAAKKRLAIIHADSRQIYRYMDIGTGKADSRLLTNVTQYALDLIEPTKNFSVYQYLSIVAASLEEAHSDNREVWISGGTGLYIRAVVEGLPLGAVPRPQLRKAIEARLRQSSSRLLAQEFGLALRDPDNPVRLIRAVEALAAQPAKGQQVYQYFGLAASAAESDAGAEDIQTVTALQRLSNWSCGGIFVLDPGPQALSERIRVRVRSMFGAGLLEELKQLRQLGYGEASVVRHGIAYREAGQVLDNQLSLEEGIERAIVRTRQYAKRQRTYFRGRNWAHHTQAELNERFTDSRQLA